MPCSANDKRALGKKLEQVMEALVRQAEALRLYVADHEGPSNTVNRETMNSFV